MNSSSSWNSELSMMPIFSHKLNGDNFLQWSRSVKLYITGRGKEQYLTRESKAPKDDDPSYKKWRVENSLVMSILLGSMTPAPAENFILYDTVEEIWSAISELYSQKDNTSEIYKVEAQLQDHKQGDLCVTDYYNFLSRSWQQLDSFGGISWHSIEDAKIYKYMKDQ